METWSREEEIDTQIRLISCHLAILRYRWERGELPSSLSVLELEFPAVDPVTGRELRYEVIGREYRLTSTAGRPGARDGAGGGQRQAA